MIRPRSMAIAVLLLSTPLAQAEDYPTRPVTINGANTLTLVSGSGISFGSPAGQNR